MKLLFLGRVGCCSCYALLLYGLFPRAAAYYLVVYAA